MCNMGGRYQDRNAVLPDLQVIRQVPQTPVHSVLEFQ